MERNGFQKTQKDFNYEALECLVDKTVQNLNRQMHDNHGRLQEIQYNQNLIAKQNKILKPSSKYGVDESFETPAKFVVDESYKRTAAARNIDRRKLFQQSIATIQPLKSQEAQLAAPAPQAP